MRGCAHRWGSGLARDLNDVISQMASHGLHLPSKVDLERAFSKYLRFRPEGQKSPKKCGWVRLHEHAVASTGQRYISGAFGVWSGSRNEYWAVEAACADWSPADRAAWLEQRKAAEKAASAERTKEAESAADKARRMWNRGREFKPETALHPYLERKKVGAFGVRLGFNERLLVPLRDVQGNLHGLQYIAEDGGKVFGTGTIKEARSHLLGQIREGSPLCFGEGYATCASAHMAAGWAVVTCFDAGNLAPVMGEYRKLYPDLEFAILADDDRHLLQRLAERLGKHGIVCTVSELRERLKLGLLQMDWQIPDGPHVELEAGWKNDAAGVARLEGELSINGARETLVVENAGQAKAHAAARKFKAKVLTPFFVDRDSPHTDWNDLHCSAGIDSVREQLQAGMDAPPEKPRANDRAQRGKGKGGAAGEGKGNGGEFHGDREGDMPFMERYTLIYGTTTVWDAQKREIVRLEALKVAYGKRVDWWLGNVDRLMVDQAHVVFDPSGKSKAPDWVNLFDRLPLDVPPPGASCARILEHIWNLCQENDAIYQWVMSWLAYPLQHPGAKMRTAIVLHGRTEGTGKSKLGDIMRRIYGRYATSVGQSELQRDFNDWLSAKLFVIGEEVVSRQDRAHLQGYLQSLIDRPTVQINTKNMPIREEDNHANFLFFSNQQVPVLLNPRDRRYTVIRVERMHPPEYFAAIDAELNDGGAEAFYQHLLDFNVGDFSVFTRPIETKDRVHLITLGMSPDQRFLHYWQSGHAGVPFCTCPAGNLYDAFKAWGRLNGERFVPTSTAFGRTVTEELERLEAPAKRSKRYETYSSKQIADGDWGEDTSSTQGILYFVPAHIERMRAFSSDDPAPAVPDPAPDCTSPDYFNARVKLFQVALHDLMASARRSL